MCRTQVSIPHIPWRCGTSQNSLLPQPYCAVVFLYNLCCANKKTKVINTIEIYIITYWSLQHPSVLRNK